MEEGHHKPWKSPFGRTGCVREETEGRGGTGVKEKGNVRCPRAGSGSSGTGRSRSRWPWRRGGAGGGREGNTSATGWWC